MFEQPGLGCRHMTSNFRLGYYPEAPPRLPSRAPGEHAGDLYPRILMIATGLAALGSLSGISGGGIAELAGATIIATALAPQVCSRTAQMLMAFGVGTYLCQDPDRAKKILYGGLGMVLINAPELIEQI